MQFRLRNFMMAALAVLAIAFTGCDPEETTLESASLEVIAQEGIDTVSVDGGAYSIAITTNRDWTIAVSQDWVTVDPEKGSGNDIVTVTVLANDDAVRKATLTITASTKTETIEIYQEGDGEGSWVVPEGSESVQGFYASASGDSYTLEDVVIDYQSGSYNFVSAGGKTVLVYDSGVASSAKVGDKISVTGTVNVYYDVMQLQYPATVNSVETSACDITPIVIDVASYGNDFMDYQNQLVCFENVTISGTTMTQADGSTTSYYNKLAITAPTSGTYDVVGYGAQYSGAHQIYPVAFLAVGEGKNYTPVVPEDDGSTDSDVDDVPAGSESVQGFYASASGDEYTLVDVVIDYQWGSYNFVSAGGKSVLVYDSSVSELASVGDKVSLTGSVSAYYNVMQLQYPITVNSSVTSTCDITPIMVDVASFGTSYMAYQNQLVCFENATTDGSTITQDGSTTAIFNKFEMTVPTSGTYDIIGYAAQYSGAHQIYPIAFLAVGEGANYTPDTSGNTTPDIDGTTDPDAGDGDENTEDDGAAAPGEVEGAIYQEFFGSTAVSATTNLGDFTDWSKLGSGAANVTYSGSDKTTIRYTYSSDYNGASGTNNIFFGTGAPTYFEVENIAVTGVTSFSLSFGTIEGSNSTNGADGVASAETFTVSYSIDGGTTYTEIPVVYSGVSGWQYVTATFETEGSDTMNLKFEASLESVQRLDDILLIENK